MTSKAFQPPPDLLEQLRLLSLEEMIGALDDDLGIGVVAAGCRRPVLGAGHHLGQVFGAVQVEQRPFAGVVLQPAAQLRDELLGELNGLLEGRA